jgi:hypothetical protein
MVYCCLMLAFYVISTVLLCGTTVWFLTGGITTSHKPQSKSTKHHCTDPIKTNIRLQHTKKYDVAIIMKVNFTMV